MPATLAHPAQTLIRTTSAATRVLHAWHLLSLDAPTVAVIWTAFFARTSHLAISPPELLALFFAVWLLYVADRLLDSLLPDSRQPDARSPAPLGPGSSTRSPISHDHPTLQPRHFFHQHHRKPFLATAILIATSLIFLTHYIPPRDFHLDLLLAAALLLWFSLIHGLAPAHRLPKELAVGLFFAAATLIPSFRPATLGLLTVAILFAALCTLNGLYISLWESHQPAAISRQFNIVTGAITAAALALTIVTRSPAAFAICLAAAALLTLDRTRPTLPPTTLRAAADLALLTPILLWPFLR